MSVFAVAGVALTAGQTQAAAAVPSTGEYPATWTVAGSTATGTSPSGIGVTATVAGPATITGSGSLLINPPLSPDGAQPSFIPSTTTEALQLAEPGNTTCIATSTTPGTTCGAITYTFTKPVTGLVLYTTDSGGDDNVAGNGTPVTQFRATLQTPMNGATFGLQSGASETPNMALSGNTVGPTTPTTRIGTISHSDSCWTDASDTNIGKGCGAYAISTPDGAVSSVTIGFSFAGNATAAYLRDRFAELLAFVPAKASIGLTKTATPTTVTEVGQHVTYHFTVSNTGNVPLSKVVVNEGAFSGTGTPPAVTCASTSIPAGGTTTCTGDYVTTQADIKAGRITNTATATGTPPAGLADVTSDPASAVVTATPTSPSTTPVPPTTSSSTGPLAATGTPTQTLVWYGAVLLALGAALAFVGRRQIARRVGLHRL